MAAHAIAWEATPRQKQTDTLAGAIRRIADGDAQALAGLYDQTSSLVYGLAMRILRSPLDAEEVVTDVYSQVWRSARAFDPGRGNATTWLVTIARSRALDRLRSRNNRSQREAPLEENHAGVITCNFEARQMVQSALKHLSQEQRTVIEMSFFAGMSHSELARRLNLPLGTVKTRMRLGMIKLRELLQV